MPCRRPRRRRRPSAASSTNQGRPAGTRQLPASPAEGRRARGLEARPPLPQPRPSGQHRAGPVGPRDTTTAAGRLVFGIFAALAEFERELIRERHRGRAQGRESPRYTESSKDIVSSQAHRLEPSALSQAKRTVSSQAHRLKPSALVGGAPAAASTPRRRCSRSRRGRERPERGRIATSDAQAYGFSRASARRVPAEALGGNDVRLRLGRSCQGDHEGHCDRGTQRTVSTMTESKTLPKTAEIHEFKPWDYERMFRLTRRLWQRPEEPDPEAAEVNEVAGAICYLLCRAMAAGAPAPTCPRCLDELTATMTGRNLPGNCAGWSRAGTGACAGPVAKSAPGPWAGRR